MPILGIDYGDKYIGLSISDSLGFIAHPYDLIYRPDRTDLRSSVERIKEIIQKESISMIVLGNPINMDNSLGFRVESTQYFKRKLEAVVDISIALEDERLSTVTATEVLDAANVKPKDRKKVEDKIAATIILQRYLDKTNYRKK